MGALTREFTAYVFVIQQRNLWPIHANSSNVSHFLSIFFSDAKKDNTCNKDFFHFHLAVLCYLRIFATYDIYLDMMLFALWIMCLYNYVIA